MGIRDAALDVTTSCTRSGVTRSGGSPSMKSDAPLQRQCTAKRGDNGCYASTNSTRPLSAERTHASSAAIVASISSCGTG